MFCYKCGAEIFVGYNFCVKCGAPVRSAAQNTAPANIQPSSAYMPPAPPDAALAWPERTPKSAKKIAFIIGIAAGCVALIAVFLLFIRPLINTGSTPSAEGNGFPTSHEAAEAYLDAFFNVDIDKLINSCAVKIFAENYDSLSQTQRLGQFNYITPAVLYDALVGFDEGLATQSRVDEISRRFLYSYRWLCLSDSPYKDYSTLLSMTVLALQGPDYYTEALEYFDMLELDFNAEKVRSVKEYMLMRPDEYGGDAYESYRSERAMRNLDSIISVYGADDFEEFIAIFTLDGAEWAITLRTLCYNGKWYAEPDSAFGIELGIPAYTSVERISELSAPPEIPPGAEYTGVRSGSASATGIRIEGDGADTAEVAVSAYMDGFLGADIEKILQACAVETYVENYDSVYAAERIRAIMPIYGFEQVYNNFSPRMATANRAGMIVSAVRLRYLFLCSEHIREGDYSPIQMGDEDELNSFYRDFARDFDSRQLRSVESFEILTIDDFAGDIRDLYNSEMNRRNIQARIDTLGADDYESFIVTFRIPDGAEWALSLSAVKYGNKWYADNDSMLAMLLNMPAAGVMLFDDFDY